MKKKTVLITGSSKGIGLGIAQKLHHDGYKVILNARKLESLKKASQTLGDALHVQADLTNSEDIEKLKVYFEKNSIQLNALVCNIGSGRSVPPGEEHLEEWQRVFDLNFFSTTNCIENLKPYFASQTSIVCISSICGHESIIGAPITYSVAKAALNAYVKAIAYPLGKDGHRINAIEPGNILFEGSVWEKKLSESPEQVQNMLKSLVPLTQLGQPEDISELTSYLISSKAKFATGSIFTIDGGQTRSF